ncbi:MAG: VanW family protein [Candidatus Falkowbacteria bacterium]
MKKEEIKEPILEHDFVKSKLLIKWSIIAASFLVICAVPVAAYNYHYGNYFFPGLRVGNLMIGGKKFSEGEFLFKERSASLAAGLQVSCGAYQFKLEPEMSLNDSLITVYSVNSQSTWKKVMAYGHNGPIGQRLEEQLAPWLSPSSIGLARIDWDVSVDRDNLLAIIKRECADLEKPAKNAELELVNDVWQLTPEVQGVRFDYDLVGNRLEQQLKNGSAENITLALDTDLPQINLQELNNGLLTQAGAFALPTSTVWLAVNHDKQQVSPDQLKSWLGLMKESGVIKVDYSSAKISSYLNGLALTIDKAARRPRFNVTNGKVIIEEAAQQGQALNIGESASNIINGLKTGSSTIPLVIDSVGVEFSNSSTTLSGIKDLLGVGTSNYTGSPVNRRHNIQVGAASLGGIIVKAGEEFSTIKALGEIGAKTGYLQELVIKENKTIPEYGGGLCQVGTTIFRAAFNSGLPITERRNHSYRVAYYEPAGTDATIYDPQPDFKFLNDTGNDILILTAVDGVNARFEIWGTKDGRKVEYTYPTIFNIVKPGPTKYMAKEGMAAGTKKCIEKAHNGADAYFDYKVTYPNGEIKEKRFSSHYVPWRAVCLVPPGDPLLGGDTATSTPSQ